MLTLDVDASLEHFIRDQDEILKAASNTQTFAGHGPVVGILFLSDAHGRKNFFLKKIFFPPSKIFKTDPSLSRAAGYCRGARRGKTQILSALAAQIIASGTLANDQEVLIVTLVNSAVDNFEARQALLRQPSAGTVPIPCPHAAWAGA